MIIAFGLTTAAIAGAVLYYRKKNREKIGLWVGTEEDIPKQFISKKFTSEEAIGIINDHLAGKRETPEPSSPVEGFQGLPDKAPIDDIAEKAIQSYKPKKYPANRRRKKRSGK